MNSRKETEVWEACDDLIASGLNVSQITGEAVANRLRELGYKAGNPNYRYKYRDTWMQARGLSREESVLRVEKHDTIDRAATIFRKQIEEGIKEEYEKKYEQLNALVAEAEDKWKNSEALLHSTLEEKNVLDQKFSDLFSEKNELQTKIKNQNDTLLVQQERLRHTESELITTRQHADRHQTDIKNEHHARVTFLETQLSELKSQHKEISSGFQKRLDLQIEMNQKESRQLQTALRESEKQSYQKDLLIAKITEENHQQKLLLERVDNELSKLKAEFKSTKNHLETEKRTLEESLAHAHKQIAQLKGELKQTEQHIRHQYDENRKSQEILLAQNERLSLAYSELESRDI